MKHIVIFILVLALLPLLFRLLAKLRLVFPLIYIALASTVFVEWTEANSALSMTILYLLLGLVALSWLLPLFRRLRERQILNRQIKAQLKAARVAGATDLHLMMYDGVPVVRSN